MAEKTISNLDAFKEDHSEKVIDTNKKLKVGSFNK